MLKHGILGLLNYSDMTGYEIMEVFRDSLNYFWNAQTSQIYRDLQTLKNSGFVTDTPVKGRGGDKKIYSITDSGREELLRWLRETRDESVRSSLLMTTFFRGELPDEENLRYFEGVRAFSAAVLEEMDAPDSKTQKYSDIMDARKKAVYWKMTVEYGRMYSKMLGEWAEKCIGLIKGEEE